MFFEHNESVHLHKNKRMFHVKHLIEKVVNKNGKRCNYNHYDFRFSYCTLFNAPLVYQRFDGKA
nr:MAG TPA: hypothetical protein [Caudoviricetes sp.]